MKTSASSSRDGVRGSLLWFSLLGSGYCLLFGPLWGWIWKGEGRKETRPLIHTGEDLHTLKGLTNVSMILSMEKGKTEMGPVPSGQPPSPLALPSPQL